jgi:hypothetical protein
VASPITNELFAPVSDTARPEVVTEPLGGSSLAKLGLERRAPPGWFEPPPDNMAEWWGRAVRIGAAGAADRALVALGGAIHATGAAADRLERVRRENGVFVTTGQQPGLFGGPIYTWSKALSALALADEIEQSTGIAAAAIFWAATDDADATEASSTVVALPGGAERLIATVAAPAGTPMYDAPLAMSPRCSIASARPPARRRTRPRSTPRAAPMRHRPRSAGPSSSFWPGCSTR